MTLKQEHGMTSRLLAASAVLIFASLAIAAPAASVQSPDKVKKALGVLAYVQADMASKLPNKAFGRLPHENQEFQEAAPALTDAVAAEPAELRAEVTALLKKSQDAANHVAEVSKTNDEAKIAQAVASVDQALKSLDELFPPELRPAPIQPGNGRPGGPPKELR
jgi:hypothetical protein